MLISLKSNEQCEQIANFAHQKWATMSDLLRWLRGNERCERITHFAHPKKEQMSELLIFLSESLICKFLDNKRAICSEIKWANFQPWKLHFCVALGHCQNKQKKRQRQKRLVILKGISVIYQGWKFAHSLIAHLLICSFAHFTQIKWVTVSEPLRSLKTNEWPWANHSGRSWQMSDCERFAQVTYDKWPNNRSAQQILDRKI